MPADIKITTAILIQGLAIFAVLDAIFAPLLAWRIHQETFLRLKWPLAISAALIWYGIWSWAIGNVWETVYSHVFPVWGQDRIPCIAAIVAPLAVMGLWVFASRAKANPVLVYCLMGGTLGSLTHIWAVYRGIVTKPPLLQGASPVATVAIAFFEYMFYWCVILTLAGMLNWLQKITHFSASGFPWRDSRSG